jgi:glyoxylase-like metal-dependent hydrolase (beta-lactamase superfamily II)
MHRPIPNSPRRGFALRAAVLGAALALGTLAIAPAQAAAPMVKTQAPGYFRLMLGQFEVTALSDGTVDLPMDKFLKEPAAVTTKALAASWLGVPTETSVNAFLINTGTKLVLVDTGAGGLFGPTLGGLVASLKAAGYQPEQVDDIVITHMHGDHIGGLSADGKLAFPNATLHADQHDVDFWLSKAQLEKAPADQKGAFQGAMGMVNPYIAAGHFQPITADGDIVPGVRSQASYGHTPGHTVYVVESGGKKLVLIGDLIHVGAVQFAHPEVTIAFDSDTRLAAAQRAKVFAQAAKDGAIVGAAHIQFPGLGHLRAAGKGWTWVPVNWSQNR